MPAQRARLQRQASKIKRLEASQRTRQTLELCKPDYEVAGAGRQVSRRSPERQVSRRSPERQPRRLALEGRRPHEPYPYERNGDVDADKSHGEVQADIYFTLLKWQSMAIALFVCWGANHLFRLAHVEVTWN